MALRRRPVATTLSTARARLVQYLDRSRRLSGALAGVFPRQFGRPAPRRVMQSSPRIADLARPLRFPQRGRGVLVLDDLPSVESTEFESLVRAARSQARVLLTATPAPSRSAVEGVLVLAASGAPLEMRSPTPEWMSVLPPDFMTLLAESAPEAPLARERRSVQLRRVALDELWGSAVEPEISILLATRRPADLPSALAQISTQVGCRPRVVLGLHGEEWPSDDDEMFGQLPAGSSITRFDSSQALGEILTTLSRIAETDRVTKWDDDDWYGPNHLADLIRAHDYSGADIVGKAAEFVRLEQSDVTLRRFAVGAESYSWTLAGGTLLTTRSFLESIGHWPRVRSGVDRALLHETRRAGGTAYRTHGFEYLLRRRHQQTHTWASDDEHFSVAAMETRPGLDLDFAGVSAR